MANHGCINGTLEGTDKYSAPVPLIGLYIAAASAVCSLLLLYDIVHGFIKMQRWLPCKKFKLNSVTLSLIGVVVKLTLDLTTSMPSTLDQLSKLSGTTSLCIYMCYIFPSLGDMKDSTNMYALSILVITVFVNMCIQLSTGVIALFLPEHIAVLCLMLLLLLMLWNFVLTSKIKSRSSVGEGKIIIRYGYSEEKTETAYFLKRLKICYLENYKSNPQFVACRQMDCGVVGDLSLISLVILVQAAVRSVVLKKEHFCTGNSSDYLWSMGIIVVTQLVSVTIGTFASYFRRCTMTSHVDRDKLKQTPIEEPYISNPIWKRKFLWVNATNKAYLKIIVVSYLLFSVPILTFSWLKSKMRSVSTDNRTHSQGLDEFNHIARDKWTLQKSVRDMEKLTEESKKKSSDLGSLLSRILPPRQSSNIITVAAGKTCVGVRYLRYPGTHVPIPARLLELVVLLRIAEVAIPESFTRNIILAFREAFETLHFIDKHMHNSTPWEVKETEVAKADGS